MSYCNGTITIQSIEVYMISKMHDLGYSEDEIEKIQSQMCVVSIATDKLNSPQKSNWIYFLDVNDEEVNDNVTPEDREILAQSAIGEAMIMSKAVPAYLIDGNGEHGLKKQFGKGKAMPTCLTSVMSRALKSSIESSKGNFNALTLEELTADIGEIIKQALEGKTLEELMQNYYEGLDYGVERLTLSEIKLLDELDKAYDELERANKEKLKLTDAKSNFEKISNAVESFCTEMTAKKIFKSIGYHYKDGERVDEALSDKQIIEEVEVKLSDLLEAEDVANISSRAVVFVRKLFAMLMERKEGPVK